MPTPIGPSLSSRLVFCGEQLCTIELRHRIQGGDNSTWIDAFAKFSKALENKYGGPNVEERTLPVRCQSKLVSCLGNGDAELIDSWIWEKGVRLLLSMNQIAKEPVIRLTYRRPPQARDDVKLNTSAL